MAYQEPYTFNQRPLIVDNFYYGKKILVTGANGFIGTNLVKKLSDLGANVRGTYYSKSIQIIAHNVEYVKADLTIKSECDRVIKNIDYVFMCAANSSGAEVMEKSPLTHLTPNVVMNALMLESSYAHGVKKFCFISSNTVYPTTNFAVSESDVNFSFFEKYQIVGWMKLFSEQMCDMYSNHIKKPMKTLIVRPGNLYGPFDKYNWNESKVIAALIRRFAERQNPLSVWGDGNDIKDFLYIDDFIDGLIKTFSRDDILGPINIASGIPATIKDVINSLIKISENTSSEVIYDSSKPTMIPIRLISIKQALEKTNWKPSFSLYDGLKRTYNWYLAYYKDQTPEAKNDY